MKEHRALVVVESPLKGDIARNVLYADCCLFDSIALRHEAPSLGHLQNTRVLDDSVPEARAAGIAAHVAWIAAADVVAVYVDLGITDGMTEAIRAATALDKSIDYRSLGADWESMYIPRLRATPGFFDCRR